MIVAVRRYLPGLIFALAVTFVGFNIHWRYDTVSPLVASLVIGVIIGNLGVIPKAFAPGSKPKPSSLPTTHESPYDTILFGHLALVGIDP